MKICGKRAFDLLSRLSFERLGGSPEELKAADILVAELAEIGLSGVKEPFEIDSYKIQKAKLTITEPYQAEYIVTGYGLTGNTPETGLEAELLYVQELTEVDLQNAAGKIVLINGRVSLESYTKLAKAKPAGMIVISGNVYDNIEDTDLQHFSIRPGYFKYGKIPGVTIRAMDALDLLQREACRAKIELQQDEYKATSQNVVVDIPGTAYPDELIVFTAHYDSVVFSAGSNDNGAGSVILMEMVRYFNEHKPARSLRFIWCGSEEIGLLGSFAYVKDHQDELDKIKLNVNVDVGGGYIGNNVTIVTAPADTMGVIDFICKEMGVAMRLRHDVYSSDSVPFAEYGIPGVNFCRFGAPIHNRHDQLQYISADRLAELGEVTLEFSRRAVNASYFPVAKELPESIKKAVIKYLQNSRGKDMDIPTALKSKPEGA